MMPPTVSYARNVRKLVSQTRQDKKQIKAQDIPGLAFCLGDWQICMLFCRRGMPSWQACVKWAVAGEGQGTP